MSRPGILFGLSGNTGSTGGLLARQSYPALSFKSE
jgi:hypothetical protein